MHLHWQHCTNSSVRFHNLGKSMSHNFVHVDVWHSTKYILDWISTKPDLDTNMLMMTILVKTEIYCAFTTGILQILNSQFQYKEIKSWWKDYLLYSCLNDSERDHINNCFCDLFLLKKVNNDTRLHLLSIYHYGTAIVPNALNRLFYLILHSNPIGRYFYYQPCAEE